MVNNIAFLFDLDGVIIDTEPQYDIFWEKTADKYKLNIDNFVNLIKGTTSFDIMSLYFSGFSKIVQQEIISDYKAFELNMDIIVVPGALDFLEDVKNAKIPMGLVTSSDDYKINYIFSQLTIRHYFDTVVSAGRITKGKPDPMCYLLAAQDLNISPWNCFVFEDSFNGIKSGNAAGMKVIGLSTTNPVESIVQDCIIVISDFRHFSLNFLLSLKFSSLSP